MKDMKKYESPSLDVIYCLVDVLTASGDEYEGEIDFGNSGSGQSTDNLAW